MAKLRSISALVACAALTGAQALEKREGITVTGKATHSLPATGVKFQLSFEGSGKKPNDARNSATQLREQVVSILKAFKIPSGGEKSETCDLIKTKPQKNNQTDAKALQMEEKSDEVSETQGCQYYQFQTLNVERWTEWEGGRIVNKGFKSRNVIDVASSDVVNGFNLIDRLMEVERITIEGVHYTTNEYQQGLNDVIAMAVVNGKKQAQTVANASDMVLGDPVRVQVDPWNLSTLGARAEMNFKSAGDSMASPATSLAIAYGDGQVTLQCSVEATYAFYSRD